jgi:hypothetical protein
LLINPLIVSPFPILAFDFSRFVINEDCYNFMTINRLNEL